MKPLQFVIWIFGIAFAIPATAAPEVWVGTIPAHTIACTSASADGSDAEAVAQASQAFINRWPEERLLDLGPMFTKDAEVPGAITFCTQYFGDNAPLPEGLVLQAVPASPGLFAYCLLTETEPCEARFTELLGDMGRGERWLRSRFGWVKPGRELPESIPERAELERIAAEPDSLMILPDAESELLPVGKLMVARLTEKDANRIRAELTRPSKAPDSGEEPPPPEENP